MQIVRHHEDYKVFEPNLAHDPDRVAYYAERGIREIHFHGGNTGQETYLWLYNKGAGVICQAQSVFNWPDEVENYGVELSEREYLELICHARVGEVATSASSMTVYGSNSLQLYPDGTVAIRGTSFTDQLGRLSFDCLFLDSLSIIENSEPSLRSSRTISAGLVEACVLDLVRETPKILHDFSPREFEYLVGAYLSSAGFSNVRLSRYVKDGGYDLWCVYCEGDRTFTVVVEAKHYSRSSIGLAIIDRLNGVRDREAADKGIVFTTSSFSAVAKKEYAVKSNRIALVDLQRLTELLQSDTVGWKETPSKLWTRPFVGTQADTMPENNIA